MSWPGPEGKPGYHCRAFVFDGKDPVTGGIKQFVVAFDDRPWWANESGHVRKGKVTWGPDYSGGGLHPDSKEAWVTRQANQDWSERQRRKDAPTPWTETRQED